MKTLIIKLILSLSSIFLIQSISAKSIDLKPEVYSALSESMKRYSENWTLEHTVMHFRNHVYNVAALSEEMLEAMENGMPKVIRENPEGLMVSWDAVPAEEVRRFYGVDEIWWEKEENVKKLKRFMKKTYKEYHDLAKLATSPDVLKEWDLQVENKDLTTQNTQHFYDLDGKRTTRPSTIESLHDGIGEDPFHIPKNTSKLKTKKLKNAKRNIRSFNAKDKMFMDKAINARGKFCECLAPEWIKNLLENSESYPDYVERTKNPVTLIEMNRIPDASSYYEVKQGKVTEFKRCYTLGCSDDFIKRRMFAHLEDNYTNKTQHFDKAMKDYSKLKNQLKFNGVDMERLDPIRRFELLEAFDNGAHTSPLIDDKSVKELIVKNHSLIIEISHNSYKEDLEINFLRAKMNKFKLGVSLSKKLFKDKSPSWFLTKIKDNPESLRNIKEAILKTKDTKIVENLILWEVGESFLGNEVNLCK